MRSLKILGFILLILGFTFASGSWGSPRYAVKPTIKVKGKDVRFLDIFPMARKVKACVPYARMVVARSPSPGMWISISGDYVRARLRESGGAVCAGMIRFPETIRVLRDCVRISESRLVEIARKFIHSCFGKGDLRCEVESIRVVPKTITLPAGRITHRCFPPSGSQLWGKRSFPIVFYVNGKEKARVWAQCSVRVYAPVVVAARPIEMGSIIGPDDVRLEERDITGSFRDYVMSVDGVVGKRAKRFMFPGSPVLSRYIDSPPVVKRGKRVTIVLDTDTLRITVPGVAKQDGRIGDVIKVENLTSKKVIFGEVVSSSEVRVNIQ